MPYAMSYVVLYFLLSIFPSISSASSWSSDQVLWNLNQNESATDPLDYWGEWANHTFNPSPQTWRFPFYMLTLDRYVDGDPTNNDANGTVFENEWMTNQFRFGGDARGLMNHLDYIQGLGIKAIYLSGSPFINQPWAGDGFGPLDFTLLDHHHGTIADWRALITEMHNRGMYVILDNTIGTMGNLLTFAGWENETVPFNADEYDVAWISDRRYLDFAINNAVDESCQYPVLWADDGYEVNSTIMDQFRTCRDSEFDQYGDMVGVGYVPPYQSQLSKFASVQDRLRLWKSSVLEKVMHFSCMEIAMLDIDGFRVDKALQTPAEQLGQWAAYQRECARRYGKDNFLITGEAVGELKFSSIFFGRGKSPDMYFNNQTEAQLATNETQGYIRESGDHALDGAAFHYPTYGAMTRFLGLDGAIGFEGVDFAEHWNSYLLTDDMVNPGTGVFDPRHMFGMTNQDVFRWPSLMNGTQRQVLGFFITFLEMPGIPMVMWGEEQEYKVLENLAADYIFGRQPMASTRAWQAHGCYKVGASGNGYFDMPFGDALTACQDDNVSLDQRNPAAPLRNLIKRMFELRVAYPVLNDGFTLQTLFFDTHDEFLPYSGEIPTPLGIWSVYRGRTPGIQDLSDREMGNQGVWLVYANKNQTTTYTYDCDNATGSLVAPFPDGTTIKNLFYPYEEYTLNSSTVKLGIEDSDEINGCLPSIELEPWGWKAFVPIDKYVASSPVITGAMPQHDARIQTGTSSNATIVVPVTLSFNRPMDCGSIIDSITISSTTQTGIIPSFDVYSAVCQNITSGSPRFVGEIMSTFQWTANLINVTPGVHTYTLTNASSADRLDFTNTKDRFLLRVGAIDNPIVFPESANYTTGLIHLDSNATQLKLTPKAIGASHWRYSTNWGSSWSDWTPYTGDAVSIEEQAWSGTTQQSWNGVHIITQYWNDAIGSTDHIQHSDLETMQPRRWPHAHVQGSWNEYGYDAGLHDNMRQGLDGLWKLDLSAEWPSSFIVNVWGINPDGVPDKSAAYGDVDGDNILDWVPPDSLAYNEVNVTQAPGWPYTAYAIVVNDANMRYYTVPTGSAQRQLSLYILLALLPLISGCLVVYGYQRMFYRLNYNSSGLSRKSYPFNQSRKSKDLVNLLSTSWNRVLTKLKASQTSESDVVVVTSDQQRSRTILIGTLEYMIEDWSISIKIGGLGVMSSLMAKHLGHHNLIWVVPCVGDVTYPIDCVAEPMTIEIMDKSYLIDVQYHTVGRIIYVLLDAPLFRRQTKKSPYPSRMDDMDSAIYYSAWNSCIAKTIERFPEIDVYHINDYHGSIAPLHLLPRVIPCCLSLHNAEFQGLWSINTPERLQEMSKVFNLDQELIKRYVQWGDNFNLLHAGASYLRIHQKGFGVVGVSEKYGKRSFARYPIFWGLPKVGILPNPDPTDIEQFDMNLPDLNVTVDGEFERNRKELRKQAQEWAGLEIDENAELFVFVGRWSMQKGVDLIADIFASILQTNSKVQLICVGPIIDLYGKFAALKLSKLMQLYPRRVFSRPEFVFLPPFIYSGAEFALIPSRDEPFGLVSVEFGRKGALGVGAKVGGLGQMPGWWFNIESATTKHLLVQFRAAILAALASDYKTRATMRARCGGQRFPVVQWVNDLEALHLKAISVSEKILTKRYNDLADLNTPPTSPPIGSLASSAISSPMLTRPGSRYGSRNSSRVGSHAGSRVGSRSGSPVRGPNLQHVIHRLSSLVELPASIQHSRVEGYVAPGPVTDTGEVGQAVTRLVRVGNIDNVISGTGQSPDTSPDLSLHSDQSYPPIAYHTSCSTLSVNNVVGERNDYKLQAVDQAFTDSTMAYHRLYERMLDSLDASNSEGKFCIEDFIHRAERDWYSRFYEAKQGKSVISVPRIKSKSLFSGLISITVRGSPDISRTSSMSEGQGDSSESSADQFMITANYKPPTGLVRLMMLKVGDWPVYSFLLALGQILSVNSHQITIISGTQGSTADRLYVIASVYLVGSLCWWGLLRNMPSRWTLSLPFATYSLAFLLIGVAPYGSTAFSRGWIQNIGSGLYSFGSSSGSLFFTLNFGSEGGVTVRTLIFRACSVQGIQQLWIAALWYWSDKISVNHTANFSDTVMNSKVLLAIMLPIAILMGLLGIVLFFGLPEYYSASPGSAPRFYRSILTRKIVLWFLLTIIIQTYWLSAPYGRNWQFLFSSVHVPAWVTTLLLLAFFLGVWGVSFHMLALFSTQHSWFLPIFSAGLGSPRWCQMLWATSGIGVYIPWGSVYGSVIASRSLWLWLGVLDNLQGVGIGVMLLQTLTRHHIAVTLIVGQVLGSIATIAARASAPDATGPGSVFPNLAVSLDGLGEPYFWVCLCFQSLVPLGFLVFFRKEQLFKP